MGFLASNEFNFTFSSETSLFTFEDEVAKSSENQLSQSNSSSFVTPLFFATQWAIHVGLVPCISNYLKFLQQLIKVHQQINLLSNSVPR